MDDAGKGNIANLHDEVDMGRHETETMYAAAELIYSELKNQVLAIFVAVVEENRLPGIAAKDDVVECTVWIRGLRKMRSE